MPIEVNNNALAELYRFAFNQIAPKDDWKGPIDCAVPWETANVYMQAIEFMTATQATCTRIPDTMHARLVAPGYRNGPAGG